MGTTGTDELHPAAAGEGAERARAVRDMFARIARRYDLVNRVASLGLDVGWRRRVASSLGLEAGDWCLDACCGTGDLGVAVATRTGAHVLGIDFCRPMLLGAAAKRRGAPTPALVEGDALALPVRDGSMDAACVAFGVRNLADPAAGLAELRRCVRVGGRVAVLEFSRPRNGLVRWGHRLYCDHVVPRIGDWLSGRDGTYRYLPQTISRWLEPAELADLMRRAGLADIQHRPVSLGVVTLHVGVVPATSDHSPETGHVAP